MENIITLSQLILLLIFALTLKCEMSKYCSDSFIFVSVRTLIMCAAAISFFLLFESEFHNLLFLAVVFVPILSGSIYLTLETMSPTSKINYKKEICNVFNER